MVLGDPFAEPLSGKWTRISGAGLEGVKAVPCGGGYLAMLDSATLTCELRALQALREYRDSIVDSGLRDAPLPSQRLGVLKNALEELAGVRARGWAHLVHTTHNLETQRQAAGSLASDGGTAGVIAFGNTGLLIPALIGMEIPDPGGSDLEVPILGVESDWHSGQLIPLAGTMEDPDGKGLIPIMFGARCVDPVTGEIAPVVGARVDPRSRIVLPVTQRLGYTRQEAAIEMFDGCDEELRTRRVYWQQQRHREGALAVDVIALLRRVLDPGAENALEKVEERARDLEDDIVSLRQSVGAEAQLRYTEEPYSATYDVPADIVRLVSQGAREEMEWELRWLTETQEILDTVTQFTHRVRQELGQHICRVREGVSPRERDSSTLRYQQVKTHLMQELQRNLMSRQTEMDLTYSRLEHARALSELYMLEARV
ncbi:uncharacterized protein si:dkey-103g5.4 [Callorhinchus milii]|uniref:uncharacterized protein si:dkey-103g5.4 n=1 Tax=Callorhinchus milii TaxID=7868 RepID=UPI001C3F9FC3|nr:uncharacterized protein si:dkey-103g5.4 [Callorhinchus milii]